MSVGFWRLFAKPLLISMISLVLDRLWNIALQWKKRRKKTDKTSNYSMNEKLWRINWVTLNSHLISCFYYLNKSISHIFIQLMNGWTSLTYVK